MNADQPDFEPLRRLLKLKRYEQPPPRYFNDFSGQVINRIKSGMPGGHEDALEHLALAPQWWRRLIGAFREGPILAGACVTAVLAVLVGGVIFTENPPPVMDPRLGLSGSGSQALAPSAPVLGTFSPLATMHTNADSSLNGIFDIQLPTQPAGYRPPDR